MNYARIAAVVTWFYAAGFGIPVIPVATYLLRRGRLPTFFDLFPICTVARGPRRSGTPPSSCSWPRSSS